MERLSLVQRQIAEVEAERDAVVRQGEAIPEAVTREGSEEQAAAKIATLTQLKGIGANDATLLEHEIFYRDFRNRRELAGWVGLTPTPWASGDTQRDQGIGRDGPDWIRALLIQIAWRWLRHQPDSALSPSLTTRFEVCCLSMRWRAIIPRMALHVGCLCRIRGQTIIFLMPPGAGSAPST